MLVITPKGDAKEHGKRMASIKQNKRNGHRREAEIAVRSETWPPSWQFVRTGLDGGHDLTGKNSTRVGEVKAVRSGPVWLKDGLRQIANSPDKEGYLFVCLSQGPGYPVKWLTLMPIETFENLIDDN